MERLENFFLVFVVFSRFSNQAFGEGCTKNTISQYCPSTCRVEREINTFERRIEERVMMETNKLSELQSELFQSIDSLQNDMRSPFIENLMTPEQEDLKSSVKELEENARAQRKEMTQLLREIHEQERTLDTLQKDLTVLSHECNAKCAPNQEPGDETQNFDIGFPPISTKGCENGLCKKAVYGVTILARSAEGGKMCREFSAPELRSCAEWYARGYRENGIYHIKPETTKPFFSVYCDMKDSGGGWTVIQRRVDGSLAFNKTWSEYENGFGNVSCTGEFWLGNKKLASIGLTGYQTIRITLTDWEGETRVAQYSYFKVNQANHHYTLQISAFEEDESNASDSMTSHMLYLQNNMRFTTGDRNNIYSRLARTCKRSSGGWWFNKCNQANLNGFYHKGQFNPSSQPGGIVWTEWKGVAYSLRKTEMKLRPYGSG